MGFTFRKKIRFGPLSFNFGKSGLTSVGIKAGRVSYNRGRNGRRTTSVDLPGPVNWKSTGRRKQSDS